MRIIISVSDFVSPCLTHNVAAMGRDQFLIDKISALSAYIIRNTDNIWDTGILSVFYRAMHDTDYTAKRGLAIACRSCVRPSVTLVDQDHIDWKSDAIAVLCLGQLAQHLRSS